MSLIHIFANNVCKYQVSPKLSKEALACLSGYIEPNISAIERECRNISLDNIENITSALKC